MAHPTVQLHGVIVCQHVRLYNAIVQPDTLMSDDILQSYYSHFRHVTYSSSHSSVKQPELVYNSLNKTKIKVVKSGEAIFPSCK